MNAPIVVVLRAVSREAEALACRPLLGVPLFLRNILTIAESGFTRFAVIAPAHARRHVLRAWQKYAVPQGLHLDLITCRPEHRLTAETLAALRRAVAPRAVFLDSNTLVAEQWVRESLRPALAHGRPVTGPGRLLTAGEMQQWAGTLPPEGIRVDRLLPAEGWSGSTAAAPPVTTRRDWRAAERFLCEGIRRAATGVVARQLNKRLSLPLSRCLARARIHPHIITAFNMLVGLAAGIGTGGVTYWGLLVGAALFQLASILDGCDGEVAKLTFRTSKFGQYIDTVSDNFALASFLTGLVIHEYREGDPTWALVRGAVLFGGLIVLLGMMIRFLVTQTDSASLVTFEKEYLARLVRNRRGLLARFAWAGKAWIKKDAFSLTALVFAVAGILPRWLDTACAVVWIAVATVVALRWQYAQYAIVPRRQPAPAGVVFPTERHNADARL